MNKEAREYWLFQKKLATMKYAKEWKNVSKACRTFSISRAAFYRWRKIYEVEGEAGLKQRRPIAKDHPRRIPESTVEKVLELRRTYHLGPQRIVWYLDRYHGITIAFSSVYRILIRHGLRQLPNTISRRELHTRRYAKQVPGHHIQMDVKVLNLVTDQGTRIRRYQYTAIDDATRVRALKIYQRHNQENAIQFVDYVIQKFPFRIHTIRTDRGHEWQAKFHWHVGDQGILHTYIRPRSPQLNGKAERSHRTDKDEFYQFLTYKDDVDLNSTDVIGQSRAVEAIGFGIGIREDGYNLFAMGPEGVGRRTIAKRFLDRAAGASPVPRDWCYIFDFGAPHRPRAIALPAGRGAAFKRDMERLVEDLRTGIPAAFEADEYRTRKQEIENELPERQEHGIQAVGEHASQQKIGLLARQAASASRRSRATM